jgi:hypothetical protein
VTARSLRSAWDQSTHSNCQRRSSYAVSAAATTYAAVETMKMKQQVLPADRRLACSSAVNVRPAAYRHRQCARPPAHRTLVPAAVPQQPRIQALDVETISNRNVLTRVSHNDGLEVGPDISSRAAKLQAPAAVELC